MRKEKIACQLFVDTDQPNVLVIRTKNRMGFQPNSVYDINLPKLVAMDGSYLEEQKVEYITSLDSCYIGKDDVAELLNGLPIKDIDIFNFIKQACKEADYWAFRESNKDTNKGMPHLTKELLEEEHYYPFYMFIKFMASYKCLKNFYINMITQPIKIDDKLSDLERQEEYDLDYLKDLLKDLKKQADDWLELVITITADPQWALRGKYSYAIDYPFSRPYHKTGLKGFNRGY